MTLIISEISEDSIIMLGDSAISERLVDGTIRPVSTHIAKTIYMPVSNIAISMWGFACLETGKGPKPAHPLKRSLLQRLDSRQLSFDEIAEHVCDFVMSGLTPLLGRFGGWDKLACGYHIGGFVDNRPCLYHVHCREDEVGEDYHEPRVYKDFPGKRGKQLLGKKLLQGNDDLQSLPGVGRSIPDSSSCFIEPLDTLGTFCGTAPAQPSPFACPIEIAYASIRNEGFFHLRNGIISEFVDCFDNEFGGTPDEARRKNARLRPVDSLGRYEFFKLMIDEICDMYGHLRVLGPHLVGKPIYGCVFNNKGEHKLFFEDSRELSEEGCYNGSARYY